MLGGLDPRLSQRFTQLAHRRRLPDVLDGLDAAVTDDARGMLEHGTTGQRHYGPNGERRRDEVTVFVEAFAPPPHPNMSRASVKLATSAVNLFMVVIPSVEIYASSLGWSLDDS